MVRHTFRILLCLLQHFKSLSDHFGTLCTKELTLISNFLSYTETRLGSCQTYMMERFAKIVHFIKHVREDLNTPLIYIL